MRGIRGQFIHPGLFETDIADAQVGGAFIQIDQLLGGLSEVNGNGIILLKTRYNRMVDAAEIHGLIVVIPVSYTHLHMMRKLWKR